ncbi:solute carrier family 28 member 3 [Biomphalaria glabrata]|uniref:Sodium/nucleoside cotransporter 1-like isoform X1 n=3 Tax=Biomphalaria glabrata TaxID=6526 RepID=A0A9W2ZH11_BIOGL|nr:sodium/nucleoside cotransporter 1-like isoform X1 [Biomphalaria glabrata]XP_055874201.1 sodium/nucleoside cotransporter 1-like isoform X1 [Biomphalaria glabrata]XP_055874202.1 sodium/nucleoside cotransporter 1-like isoform X1 [Biomphalaria glabrata]XP_055874203.1 sodium/nucleoside cotransporter 1-like isoform X1 [Biomphalaria glabrata]XP_055874204.1 sodium/nucleoside cotransporter 1-like isoform X1 [Biomphalaria glabrata]KAI8768208.1 solute carrier family 28 member 3-like [Biomphalaria glab
MDNNQETAAVEIEFVSFSNKAGAEEREHTDVNTSDECFEEDEENDHRCITKLYLLRTKVIASCGKCSRVLKNAFYFIVLCLYLSYFTYALYLHHGENRVTGLIVITSILFLVLLMKGLSRFDPIDRFSLFLGRHPALVRHSRVFIYLACVIITCVTLVTEVVLVQPKSLISVTGIVAILTIFFLTSTHPHKISWQPVLLGLFLQYVFALAILRLQGIREMFVWCGDVVKLMVQFSKAGGKFLFGSLYTNEGFVFHLIPLIAFVIAILSILEHLGVLHSLLRILGRFLAFCTGASPAESLNASANIFMGPIDSLMVIRPYLKHVTESELHCLMANAMSTVTGSIIGLYISFGISADHLLAASVMSAPAALAVAKLAVPERSNKTDVIKRTEAMIPVKRYRSVMDAFSSGAVSSFTLAGSILANVTAVVSFMDMINATLRWLGELVNIQNFTLQWICSYLFYPLALSLGVDPSDGHRVAELLGIKVFINELVAYAKLGDFRKNRLKFEDYINHNYTDWYWSDTFENVHLPTWNITLTEGFLSARSEVITTYALCGFANFISVGVIMGCYLVLVPHRKTVVFKYVFRSMVVGHCASFLTACIAGLFL